MKKLTAKCPFCQQIMVTDFEGDYVVRKKCNKYIDHQIILSATIESDEIYRITILLSSIPKIEASWYLETQRLLIMKEGSNIFLPFFDPDLSNFKKLVDKVKTYLVFS